MKFLTKINRNFFILFGAMLLVISIADYFILDAMFLENAREGMLRNAMIIKHQIENTKELPLFDPLTKVTVIQKPSGKLKSSIKEIDLYNTHEQEMEPYAEYNREVYVNGVYYNIQLRQKMLEKDDLILSIGTTLFLLLLITFSVSFFVNRKMNKTIWKGFENNLHEIEGFNLARKTPIHLEATNIDEFDRLNEIIYGLTKKIQTDYSSLKEFTENASHELQTPLSIVLFNLEELLQQPLNEEDFKKVVTSINALKKLSHLNQSLLLLAKIENNQFAATEDIDLLEIIERKLKEFEPLIHAKKIAVEWKEKTSCYWQINPYLAEILISNLLSNALNHNTPKGSISIRITKHELAICNTGVKSPLNDETIFNRFVKGDSKSHGLGLAIVKQICETHNATIHYEQGENHCFKLTLPIE
ncbi:sensor histidine kinase [Microbacter margulisiae]|uniref:histidine kinase n=1 Tax=Microbacter margulisiae TaxID=1350067 RepID=A0A7W5DRE7_9PORP|nr:HAMP domain-containing sensor histidine kinase [Microbacter margulisiae]MBB3187576.1 signal transduction histidine kinase [Microbacter margulisiae]